MPRKANKRKAIQKAKLAAQPKPKRPKMYATIGHVSDSNHGLTMAILASGLLRGMSAQRPADDFCTCGLYDIGQCQCAPNDNNGLRPEV